MGEKVLDLSADLRSQEGRQMVPRFSQPKDREEKLRRLMRKEAVLDVALRSPAGIAKVAANLVNLLFAKLKFRYMLGTLSLGDKIRQSAGKILFYENRKSSETKDYMSDHIV